MPLQRRLNVTIDRDGLLTVYYGPLDAQLVCPQGQYRLNLDESPRSPWNAHVLRHVRLQAPVSAADLRLAFSKAQMRAWSRAA